MSHDATSDASVRVRFAPSPTGTLHLGSALVAVANAAYAKASGGVFVLRIDDTDAVRSRDEDTLDVLRLLRWLGVEWDEGPIHQRDQLDKYRAALDLLRDRGDAYPCFCTEERLAELREQQRMAGEPPRYDGRCRKLSPAEVERSRAAGAPHVWRFAVPEARDVVFDDIVHGRVAVPAGSFGDPVLSRSDGSVGYLLASVVDDLALRITHVIRGEDHLHNTARQLLLFEALEPGSVPKFAHTPLLRESDGRKLSKRDPMGTLDALVEEQFLPRTVRRYIAELLGQGAVDVLAPVNGVPADFRINRIPTGAPRVDRARLDSLGREDMALLTPRALLDGTDIQNTAELEPIIHELAAASASRSQFIAEMSRVLDGPMVADLPGTFEVLAPNAERIGELELALDLAASLLRAAHADDAADADWASKLVSQFKADGSAAGLGVRKLLQPLRIALTGATGGPAIDQVLAIVGTAESLRRVQIARAVAGELQSGESVVGG